MIFDLHEIELLKEYLARQNAGYIHTHDTCGGQYFSLDEVDDRTEALITEYFAERGIKAVFADNRLGFRIEKIKG